RAPPVEQDSVVRHGAGGLAPQRFGRGHQFAQLFRSGAQARPRQGFFVSLNRVSASSTRPSGTSSSPPAPPPSIPTLMPTTTAGMSAAFSAILANSASTLVGYVLMVFMYVYPTCGVRGECTTRSLRYRIPPRRTP